MDVQTMNNVDPVFKKEEVPMIIAQFWQQRAALAEREALTLKEQLAATHERTQSRLGELAGSAAGRPPLQQPEEEVQRRPSSGAEPGRDKESSELVEDLRRLQNRLAQVENHTAQQRAQLLQELETKKKTIQRLQTIIEQQKDYNEIKKGIVLLKSIKNGGSDAPDGVGDPASPADSAEKSLDVLKELQNEQRDARKIHAAPHCDVRPPLVEVPLLGFPGGPGTLTRPPLLAGPPPFPFPPLPTTAGGLASLAVRSPPLDAATRRRDSLSPQERASSAASMPEGQLRSTPEGEPPSTPTPSQHSPGGTRDTPTESSTVRVTSSASTTTSGRYRYDENDPLIPKSDPMETRLQEMLRYNMDKYANQSLDTLQLARRVRELLSGNNIGQRMFARYILGLSQGTVSELLSKPKTWEKLTEKGRDSYRKMHAWAVDDAAVCLLKAVIPKRGKEASRPTFPMRGEEGGADDRIAHILTEAQQAMKAESTPAAGADEKPPSGAQSPSRTSPLSETRDPLHPLHRLGGVAGPGVGPGSAHDEHPQEKIARLYREHLAKMMGHRPELAPAFPGLEHYHRMRSPEEIRMAMDLYNQELMRQMQRQHHHQQQQQHQHQQQANGAAPQDLSSRVERADETPSDVTAPHTHVRPPPERASPAAPASSPPALAGGLLPGLHPAGFFMHSAAAAAAAAASASSSEEPVTSASPLQRMASITNSLMSAASLPPLPPHSSRPNKAVLPPITQQQFDQYNNLNTEQVVARIKEHLSRYSLSQRLFGESVLGLSQGSVSDLLARPKPWHMLTQKGREPFIRMRMFLDDESAVHKLVASQYKIAPEKLMRTGCYNGGKRPSFTKLPLKPTDMCKSLESPLPPVASLAQFPGLPPAALASRLAGLDPSMKFGFRLPPGQLPMSVYETAAITPELDTLFITTKIKEVLLANNIGQKLFGEVVLGLSQGSVSELLSKPKPWHLLSIKGREPFIRMKLWLEDGHNVEKLQRIKTERRENSKRRRSCVEPAGEDSGDGYSSALSCSPNSSKKSRVLFTEEQKEALQLAFALDPYPNMATVEFLCQELGLTHRTISNWFHNHRMRLKQSSAGGGESPSLLPPGGRDGHQQLEPLQFRLLLQRRLQELQREKATLALGGGGAGGVLPPGLIPFPYFGGGVLPPVTSHAGCDEPSGGLDLSMKSDDGDRCSDASADLSAGSSPTPRRADDVMDGMTSPVSVAAPAGSSRRKPTTPQWVAPQWHSTERRSPPPLINGVCVMQTELGVAAVAAARPEPAVSPPAETVQRLPQSPSRSEPETAMVQDSEQETPQETSQEQEQEPEPEPMEEDTEADSGPRPENSDGDASAKDEH